MHDAALRVMGHEGSGVALVHLQAGADGLRRVVRPALRGCASRHAADQLFLRHVEQQDVIEALAALAQCGVDQLGRSEEHTSELQSPCNLVCRLLLEKKKKEQTDINSIDVLPQTTSYAVMLG